MDSRHFPYEFECATCGKELTVTYDEAVEKLPPHMNEHDATPRRAVEHFRRAQGWWIQSPAGMRCPDCLEDRTED